MNSRPHRYLVQIGFAGDCYLASGPEGPTSTNSSLPDTRSAVPPTAPEIPRHARVLVQTPRGVELGTVINRIRAIDTITERDSVSLRILRRVTHDDERLIDRLQKYKNEAVRKCQQVLAASDSPAVLLDVDQLFDGNTLILHFLGPVDSLGRDLTDVIVQEYENEVQSIRLSELMNVGCGPGCGTEVAGGCGTAGGCAGCSIGCKTP
ncbi:hypothetical protein [Neorhodopirellula pilleata]|uniref:PSP1 C-terminal domain-containing protein n=1 Tax=Neorhodopirellula pilleata TaxID=2714738 RepID=A0A5C6AUT8_9BACT|nr:hypothetical protein [Neorhodopirellula pilleata]TWU03783.1 hypothetical protein Pla100_07130 [Neorhodopirellula pilleata]